MPRVCRSNHNQRQAVVTYRHNKAYMKGRTNYASSVRQQSQYI
jgi:hypothetical protein